MCSKAGGCWSERRDKRPLFQPQVQTLTREDVCPPLPAEGGLNVQRGQSKLSYSSMTEHCDTMKIVFSKAIYEPRKGV